MKNEKKHRDESAFVALLKSKKKEGMEQLYDRYSESLFGIIYSVVRDLKIAEDILQDTFVKIWQNIDSYDSSKGRLFTWMLNVARNGAIDYTRSKQHKNSFKVQSIDNSLNDPADINNEIKEDSIGMVKLVNEVGFKIQSGS